MRIVISSLREENVQKTYEANEHHLSVTIEQVLFKGKFSKKN